MAYKHDYDKILTRITKILYKLNDGDELSVKDLAEEFNTSTRTIQRDLNERLSSFPIYQEKKKWKMQKGFKIEKNNSIEEDIVLDIIEKITESIGGTFSTKAHNLLKKIKNNDMNPIYTKLNIEDISDKLHNIELLEKAIKQYLKVDLTYHKKNRTMLEPLKIVNYEGFWYFIALKDGVLKKYYLKDISQVNITETNFSVPSDITELLNNSISIWFNNNQKSFEVKLYATKKISKYFQRRKLPTQHIASIHKDGSIEFSMKITDKMEIIHIVKYWIPELMILEPKWLVDIIQKDLTLYLQKIKKEEYVI